jgi:WD40 repeat protein
LLNWFPSGTQLVRNHREETPLIEFMMPGDDELSLSQGVAFSPDGRFLIWGNAKGPVRVANLAALQSSLAQFESSSSK